MPAKKKTASKPARVVRDNSAPKPATEHLIETQHAVVPGGTGTPIMVFVRAFYDADDQRRPRTFQDTVDAHRQAMVSVLSSGDVEAQTKDGILTSGLLNTIARGLVAEAETVLLTLNAVQVSVNGTDGMVQRIGTVHYPRWP